MKNIYEFYPQDGGESHLALKLRHCHPMYNVNRARVGDGLLMLPQSMRSRVYVTVGRPSVRLSVCPIVRQPLRRAAGLQLSAPRAGDIDQQRRAPSPCSNSAAARRSLANVGRAMLTAELMRLNTDLLLWHLTELSSSLRIVPLKYTCSELDFSSVQFSSCAVNRA